MLRPIYLYKFDPKRLPQGKPDDVELITVSNASELPTVVDNDVLVMGKDAEEFFAANVPGAYATVLVTKIDDFDKFVGDVWIQRE
ncbi:MAG: hypothetical protein HY430_02185, partial [Candidatus Levybacteria bacterium]|nr:hypothetical protein [Candidatus Levybacteria bacterium]